MTELKLRRLPLGAALLLLAAALLPLAGCAELFEFNLFTSLDRVRVPDLESLQSMPEGEALDYLDEELDSPAFVAALSENPEALADVRDYLSTTAASDPTSDGGKRAAVLLADLELKVSGGEELVNNLASLLGEVEAADFACEAEVEQFLEANLPGLVPAEALASRAAFDALLAGFQAAWAAYETFAGAIDGAIDGDPDSADVPGAVNLGDVAQKALVAGVVSAALTSLYATPQDAADALWLMANGQDADSPTGTFDDPFAAGSSLDKILAEAGISFS